MVKSRGRFITISSNGYYLVNKKIQDLIQHFQMIPLPVEETLFHQSYKREEGTAIIGLYCHKPLSRSLFHKLTVDEIWHFYSGDPFRLILLYPDGETVEIIMGPDPLKGHNIQFTVPAGVWQAGELLTDSEYALYGCTMAPGFTEEMFTGGTEIDLIPLYPQRESDIKKLCCPPGMRKMS